MDAGLPTALEDLAKPLKALKSPPGPCKAFNGALKGFVRLLRVL
jgi:hypothetical protein